MLNCAFSFPQTRPRSLQRGHGRSYAFQQLIFFWRPGIAQQQSHSAEVKLKLLPVEFTVRTMAPAGLSACFIAPKCMPCVLS